MWQPMTKIQANGLIDRSNHAVASTSSIVVNSVYNTATIHQKLEAE